MAELTARAKQDDHNPNIYYAARSLSSVVGGRSAMQMDVKWAAFCLPHRPETDSPLEQHVEITTFLTEPPNLREGPVFS
jgi:hypothetical protein